MKVNCPCGVTVEGETEDDLVAKVEAHVAEAHPEMVGEYPREKILEMIVEKG